MEGRAFVAPLVVFRWPLLLRRSAAFYSLNYGFVAWNDTLFSRNDSHFLAHASCFGLSA